METQEATQMSNDPNGDGFESALQLLAKVFETAHTNYGACVPEANPKEQQPQE